MDKETDIQEIIKTIQREHRHTQIVFGCGILVLAIVLMIMVPIVIRLELKDSIPADYSNVTIERSHAVDMPLTHAATTTEASTTEDITAE